ncbi:uncharacterized protein MYCFIDRAFT_188044 [Pseudocercospora fijiensis CIRAD86]|uniref:DUF676 domain-containing protein n=1 Tax=Pseudocercospora fijiensis (strain CIRAD86) TaxID=383855 RepID=M3AE03_PSEFD|nr:uncharacterized protein MYCFIDRAFT_188044 [Pseudocercospora fijiensis CIRAD86]EME82756.1 hypothetical protein MYCFIDRAFT_188044 [Pseudocercospora fijiensis CIRAD86]
MFSILAEIKTNDDPRVDELIEDAFAVVKSSYEAPKHAIVLAHGLLGFDELRPIGHFFPGIAYWRGITQALAAKNVEVITAHVPPSGRIEVRAAKLAESIERQANGKAVNIIAGLDARHMVSRLKPPNVKVLSLTTVATPHRGSSFADYMFKQIGMSNIPRLYKVLEFFGMETGAFRQLTREYMANNYNPRTPDVEGVKYYSYGAAFQPHLTSVFRKSHSIIEPIEGANDGLVSVESSQWGTYKGTLNHVSHLDLINWTNRLRWYFWELTGKKRNFNAIAFYLSIADMLAKEGL